MSWRRARGFPQKAFGQGIQQVPGVRACYHVTGQFDMVVELALRNLDHFGQLIEYDIAAVSGIDKIETMLVYSEVKPDSGWPVMPNGSGSVTTTDGSDQ